MALNVNERNLILIQALDFFTSSLAGIFVTVFLFVHSDFKTTILYSLISFSSLLFFLIMSGWTLRYIVSGLLVRLSLLGSAIFYLLLFLLREQAINYLIPLAIFNGCIGGNFWAAFNLNQYIFTSKDTRIKYFGSAIAFLNGLQALAPLIGGAIITFTGHLVFLGLPLGYSLLFLLVSLVLGFSALLIGKLPEHEIISFRFTDFMTHKRSSTWLYVLSIYFVYGSYDVALGTVTGILIYLIVRQEIFLGVTQTATFLLAALGGLLAIPLLHKHPRYFWIGGLGIPLGISLFAFNQNLVGLTLFTIITGVTTPFLDTWVSTVYFSTLDATHGNWINKYHLLIERDFALGTSRILSYIGVYIFIYFGDQVKLAKTWLLFLPLFPLIVGILLHLYAKSTKKIVQEHLVV